MRRNKFLRGISFALIFTLFAGLLISATPVSAAQPVLTQGQKNIVKRARQMTEIQWTPQKDIVGWGWGLTYQAGVTYKGLPYGQPVNTSYVPWSTSLEGFLDAVNDPNSLMYTSYSSSNKRAPYYSVDCSAFVSWAWNLSSRQTTHSIAQFATAISTSSFEDAQVGDCLNKYAEHVVLITDIGYDSSGTINSIEVSESTVNSATNYCCQVVRYGSGGSKTLSEFKTKYFGNGYTLYRSKTRDSVTYEHSCAVPLEGDVCAECGIGGYFAECTNYPCYVTVKTSESSKLWNIPCSDATSDDAVNIAKTNAGDILTATALYLNTAGKYWYRVDYNGEVCYVYGGNTSFERALYSDLSISGVVAPSSITEGSSFVIGGMITSQYSRISEINANVYSDSNDDLVLSSTVDVDTTVFSLKGSTIDKELTFDTLSEGTYTYDINADVKSFYTEDGKSLSYTTVCGDLYNTVFEVVGEEEHVCDKGTKTGQQAAHPHYSKYECSVCGEVWTATNETNYSSSCTECNSAEPPTDQTVYNGIDVSHHQGSIDWDAVAPNIDFAIIRCGYGDDLTEQDDGYWHQNADACTRLGIPFGVYIYSYAVTDDQARSEAEHVLRLIEGYEPTLPIYLDLEDTKYILPNCSNEDILRHAQIFCDIIEDAGYSVGVYANYDWWTNYLTDPAYDQWSRWIARYASATGYSKDYDMWQYSSSGSIPGISGTVDLDYWYGPLPGSHEHSYTASVTSQPTCTQGGVRTYTCSCGDSYTETIAPTGHTYSDQVTQPTCTAQGYTIHTCTLCGYSYRDSYTSPSGHDYENGTCTRCGAEDPDSVMTGDLNSDGAVTSADAVLLARYLVGLAGLTDQQLEAADVNQDGTITSADSVMLARYLAGVIAEL